MATLTVQQAFETALRHHQVGRLAEAGQLYQQILGVQPDHAPALEMLGRLAHQTGQPETALSLLRRAMEIQPNNPGLCLNAAMVLAEQNRLNEAVEMLQRAVAIQPDHFEAWNNLGNVLQEQGRFEQAADAHRQALKFRPDHPSALANLASSLRDLGQFDEMISCYRRALALRPSAAIAGNLLVALHFHPDSTPETLRDEHARWNETYARQFESASALHANDPTTDRQLRIGYVCSEFHGGPTGRFLLPLIENHDRSSVEIFCYANVLTADATTARFQGLADVWRNTTSLSDEQFVNLVRDDRIDILIDCVKHMRGNRLLAFARRPAPVQVTYLPYSSTSGLHAMDYRITDPYLDAPADDRFYSERSVSLPHCYWCYAAPVQAPPVAPPPMQSTGHVTFGSLNSYLKVSAQVVSAWCRLLRNVAGSRLMISCPTGEHRRRARDLIAAQGVDPARVDFIDRQPIEQYFQQYNSIDIALDPFPYGGGTTTCDALWMGLPVVSLTGRTSVSKSGLSILSNVGLAELVTNDVDGYVKIASDLAADAGRLAELRTTMRGRMQTSPLMDSRQFARDFEAALRRMWGEWCARRTSGGNA